MLRFHMLFAGNIGQPPTCAAPLTGVRVGTRVLVGTRVKVDVAVRLRIVVDVGCGVRAGTFVNVGCAAGAAVRVRPGVAVLWPARVLVDEGATGARVLAGGSADKEVGSALEPSAAC